MILHTQITRYFVLMLFGLSAALLSIFWLQKQAVAEGNPYACVNYPQIGQGAANTCVQYAKWILNNEHNATPKLDDEDSTYDAAMKRAVLQFQTEKGLRCKEGTIGPETWNALVPGLNQSGPCTTTTTDPGNPPVATGTTNTISQDCNKLKQNFEEFGGGTPGPLANNCYSPGQAVNRAISILLSLVAILAVLFIVIGGYRYMTSSGDEKKAAAGKNTIKWALLGLGLTFFAYMIVRIVRSVISG